MTIIQRQLRMPKSECVTDRPTDRPTDWPTDRPTDRPAEHVCFRARDSYQKRSIYHKGTSLCISNDTCRENTWIHAKAWVPFLTLNVTNAVLNMADVENGILPWESVGGRKLIIILSENIIQLSRHEMMSFSWPSIYTHYSLVVPLASSKKNLATTIFHERVCWDECT